jgi:methylated-DNA-protein-cysteine methyltransferase related protein
MEQGHADFSHRVISLIKLIPEGAVATYGQIAAQAGAPRGARQVVRILHSCSHTKDLPWHRVINRQGMISLPHGEGFEEQYSMLNSEGVMVEQNGHVSLAIYQFSFRDVMTLSGNVFVENT